jgi:hypothetical protein
VYRDTDLVAEDIAVSSGSVTVDAKSDVRRTLSLTVPDPAMLTLLDPYACDLRVWRGMVFGNGVEEWVPVGLYRVWEVAFDQPTLEIAVTGQDRGALVASDEFVDPYTSLAAAVIVDEIGDILTDAGFTGLDDNTGLTDTVGEAVTWDGNRWEAINKLADALDATCYFDAIGAPILQPAQPGSSVWAVDAGESGVLVKSSAAVTRDGTYNCVIAEGESPNADTPIRAVEKDLDTDSPTYWDGTFGHAVTRQSSAVWNTQNKADRAAVRLLRESIGKVRTVQLSTIPNPALEAGDTITVEYGDGTTEDLVIDGYTLPLVGGGDFPVITRSKRTLTI